MEGREFQLKVLSSTIVVYWDTNGKLLSIIQMVKKYAIIHVHTYSKYMHTYVYIHTKKKRMTVDLSISKICETQMRYIQMTFDKCAT